MNNHVNWKEEKWKVTDWAYYYSELKNDKTTARMTIWANQNDYTIDFSWQYLTSYKIEGRNGERNGITNKKDLLSCFYN